MFPLSIDFEWGKIYIVKRSSPQPTKSKTPKASTRLHFTAANKPLMQNINQV